MTEYQFGLRKRRSTADALTKFETDIQESFHDGKYLVAIFIDISKAYDTTRKYNILRNIYSLGIRGSLGYFIENFMKNRLLKLKVEKLLSPPFPQEEGVPQGSVLSVTLFAVTINNVIRYYSGGCIKIIICGRLDNILLSKCVFLHSSFHHGIGLYL